jgi:hypothetical protein
LANDGSQGLLFLDQERHHEESWVYLKDNFPAFAAGTAIWCLCFWSCLATVCPLGFWVGLFCWHWQRNVSAHGSLPTGLLTLSDAPSVEIAFVRFCCGPTLDFLIVSAGEVSFFAEEG